MDRIAVRIERAKTHEYSCGEEPDKNTCSAPLRRRPAKHVREAIAHCHDSKERKRREIDGDDDLRQHCQSGSALVQQRPGPAVHPVADPRTDKVVERDNHEADQTNHPRWQNGQWREEHHRHTDCPENLQACVAIIEIEVPAPPHCRHLERDEHEAASDEPSGRRAG